MIVHSTLVGLVGVEGPHICLFYVIWWPWEICHYNWYIFSICNFKLGLGVKRGLVVGCVLVHISCWAECGGAFTSWEVTFA